MVSIEELRKLKYELFGDDEEVKRFLSNIVKELLNSKVKEKTLSPMMLTFREFIDVNLKRLVNAIVEQLRYITNKDEKTLKMLAAYLINWDIVNENIIYKTIATHILELIEKDHLSLSKFVSDMREIYNTPKGKFRYPVLYPFDRNRYANPLPLLKQELVKINNIKRQIEYMQNEYLKKKKVFDKDKMIINDIKLALKRINESILPHLKKIHDEKGYQERVYIFASQKKRFEVIYMEASQRYKENEKKVKALEKTVNGFRLKHKATLDKEEEIIETIAKNLATTKRKIQ
ncbi:MAG: hypothetical protein GXO62_02350 [Epsilonproteobacteria bacterium]|nr:hypothetical protein [Campylobacterota bacterium]